MNSNSTRGLIATIAGFSALGFALMALIYWGVFATPSFTLQNIDWTLRILALVAILSFVVYLLVSPEPVGRAASKRSTRLTANAFVAAAIAVGIGIVVNILAESVPTARADWTAEQQFALSPQTIKVLKDLEAKGINVTAVGFFDPRTLQGQQEAEDLLKEYRSYTTRLDYEFVDALRNRARAAQYGVNRFGVVVFDTGTKREVADTTTERDFTSALVRLGQTGTKTVAFLSGHGERDPNNFDSRGYSQVKQSLEQNNYSVITMNLITATLSVTDVSVLVIAEPTRALTANETQAIQRYLQQGGRVLMLLDPLMPAEALAPMQTILDPYEVTAIQGGVVDFGQMLNPQDPTDIYVTDYPVTDITEDLAGLATRFSLAMVVQPPSTPSTAYQILPIVRSASLAPQGWLETDIKPPLGPNIQLRYDEGTDLPGEVNIALQISPQESTTVTETNQTQPRLVVFGDSDFVTNQILSEPLPVANLDLFGNSVSWLAGANELVSIRPKDPVTARTMILDSGQKNIIFTATVLGLPLLVFLLGIFNWWRRR